MLTNYIGELLQHDTSHHLWSPFSDKKWYLITTIDDYSRRILYGDLWEKETSWAHIVALQYVVTQFGCPLRYYVDNHSIFRFVEHRDTFRMRSLTQEEEAMVQWKAVLNDLGIEVVYALSPAAKGKIERPYRWLQDHLVRTCARQEIKDIEEDRKILYEEIYHYNFRRVHSTIGEIPVARFEKCLDQKLNFFRRFEIKKSHERLEDIFCYRFKRISDAYRRISFHHLKFSLDHVPPHSEVELRISCDPAGRFTHIRFWYRGRLVGQQPVQYVHNWAIKLASFTIKKLRKNT